MKVFKVLALFLILSCSEDNLTDMRIDQFCQDLSVLVQKLEAISSNIANVNSTRTKNDGYYKRLVVKSCSKGFCETTKEDKEPILKYEPNHPDANKNGYVSYPDIDLNQEKAEQVYWKRVFDAVIEDFPVKYRSFFLSDVRAKKCFEKYPSVNKDFNFKNYLER